MADVDELYEFARRSRNSPEARLLAGAKIEAMWEMASEERRQRPTGITLEKIRAATAGLRGQQWRDPWRYGSMLDVQPAPGMPGAVKRELPLRDTDDS
jgi:hypothetical protein